MAETQGPSPELNWQLQQGTMTTGELQCVGSMKVQPHRQLGFICGTLPVPTTMDGGTGAFVAQNPLGRDALVMPALSLQSQRAIAPRYRLLPAETDLNMPPAFDISTDHLMPVVNSGGSCNSWGGCTISHSLARKCDTLAVSALSGHGDGIDVIAPVDILKQIFKTPYSKARLSVAVHRIGQTLVLNSGADNEEVEKVARQKKNQSKLTKRTLFSKFVQHSMHDPENDEPSTPSSADSGSPKHNSQPDVQVFGKVPGTEFVYASSQQPPATWHVMGSQNADNQSPHKGEFRPNARVPNMHKSKKRFPWSPSENARENESMQSGLVGDKHHHADYFHQDSEPQHQRASEKFLRVLFWQFQNLQILLGSDLLLFSNDKHVAVSLHLMEIERQVTPLMWLDAWLDNVMASVPELAICYHHNGVVQGYELLKTDDIFLLKGLDEDGTAFFQPHVVQQNGLSVLRFLQENCKEDPGTYWLFKNAGEDVMQLFNLTVTHKDQKDHSGLPSTRNSRKSYSLPLAMLLYRIAHRMSLSKDPIDKCKCAKFFQKCLEFLDEQEHLVIRAFAHEQVARLIMKCCKEEGLETMPLMLEGYNAERAPVDTEENLSTTPAQASHDFVDHGLPDSNIGSHASNIFIQELPDALKEETSILSGTRADSVAQNKTLADLSAFNNDSKTPDISMIDLDSKNNEQAGVEDHFTVCQLSDASSRPRWAVTDSVAACLAALHHVSQAIISLRWQRQLNDISDKGNTSDVGSQEHGNMHTQQFPLCLCGDIDCITVYDISATEIGFRMDQKLKELVLMLGESYLALGDAYKEECQLDRAIKSAELACSVYGAMSQYKEYKMDTSERVGKHNKGKILATITGDEARDDKHNSLCDPSLKNNVLTANTVNVAAKTCRKGRFWGQLWLLIGDIFVKRTQLECQDAHSNHARCEDLKIPQEIVKEVRRLKKKMAHKRSCNLCSLSDCSCETDRASSGHSASSSNSMYYGTEGQKHNRKYNKKLAVRNSEVAPEVHVAEESTICQLAGKLYIHPSDACTPQSHGASRESCQKDPFDNTYDNDFSSYLTKATNADFDTSLSCAVDCYDNSIAALGCENEGSRDIQSATRKKGWACNELGRRHLAMGDIKLAEATFKIAIRSFRKVQDHTNIVLVNCNLGHGYRAVAESLINQLMLVESTLLGKTDLQVIIEAKDLYEKALKFYGAGKHELSIVNHDEGGVERLRNEVVTQYAHTYLRFGMLLAKEHYICPQERRVQPLGFDNANNAVDLEPGAKKKVTLSANEAIRQALILYESLGTERSQEAAYAQYQLACFQRDCCLRAINKTKDGPVPTRAKHYASLAIRYWEKALDYYHAETHPDMFLEILMEKANLCASLAPASHSNGTLDLALTHLLEGRHAVGKDYLSDDLDCRGICPSAATVSKYIKHLQTLLKTMLGAAISTSKHSGNSIPSLPKVKKMIDGSEQEESQTSVRGAYVSKLKEMYRISLRLNGPSNLDDLYQLWLA